MSKEEVIRFLHEVMDNEKPEHQDLREALEEATNPEAFIQIVNKEGYDFEIVELEEVAHEQGEAKGITIRRPTGVWHWLRNVNWLDRTKTTSP
ncbi:Nif11-like leader peptide family natural product precursor [Roseofilum sp. Guam]|uniref:Nif11-like leader peptide family natural product precursor n=1 Tax=Roseofilum sp. Guam TaxID=2821502 RepID=UPI001B01ED11|nr:Nif11-like leader peptide family natural product precursor [Roseofilum sp. Guam]MBP0030742.1 Nif11-like leader peptide family natural product precursor [Roseofilum sp. Guam]